MCIVLDLEKSSPYSSEYASGTQLNDNEVAAMDHHLNAGAVDSRRTWDIPTIGFFTLVTSSSLIGVPLFGYIHGDTKLNCALRGFSISSAARHYRGVSIAGEHVAAAGMKV